MAWKRGASRTSTNAWKALRRKARTVLPYWCAACGRDPSAGVMLELDHVVPVAEGGADDLSNAQWLCAQCHAVKSKAESARGGDHRRRRRRLPDRYADHHPGLV